MNFAAVADLLCEIDEAGWDWPKGRKQVRSFPWAELPNIGARFPDDSPDGLTPVRSAWLRERGWLALSFDGVPFIAPTVRVDPPELCFHATPVANVPGILQRGLLPGKHAGLSTTGRADGAAFVHVTFAGRSALEWVAADLVRHGKATSMWALFGIEREGIAGEVLRDPASSFGYILEVDGILPSFLRLIEPEINVTGLASAA
jgi:hypothetical protein